MACTPSMLKCLKISQALHIFYWTNYFPVINPKSLDIMVHTFVDSALEELSRLNNHPSLALSLKPQVEAFQVELRLFKMFLGCLITWDADQDFNSKYMLSSIEHIWDKSGEGLYDAGLKATDKEKFQDWNPVASKLEEKMQQCKQEISKYCAHLISCSLKCKSFPSNQIRESLDEILNNMKHLHLPVENQIDTLKKKLLLLWNLVDFVAKRCPDGKELSDFMIHVHTWANQAACLTCLYWLNEVQDDDEEIGKKLNLWLIDLLQKVNPCTPEFTSMCFAVMKSTKSSRADTFIFARFLSNFVDFLLQNLAISLEDEFEILLEELIFLISFLVDPPMNSVDDYALNLTRSQTDDILSDASRLICSFSGTEEDLGRYRTNLLDILRKIHSFRGQIEKLYVQIPNFSFPKTNGLRFVDHLLGNIEDLTRTINCNSNIVFFAKHQIFRVKEGLLSLRQTIHAMRELLNDHKEMKDLWDKMIHVAYKAELAINSSFTIDHPIWYHLACLSNVLGDITDVRNEFEKFKKKQIYGPARADPKLPSVCKRPFSGMDEIVVGFNDEEQVLIDRITRGTAQLDIVPIVGMGGLARKLYKAPSVRCHFIVRAFCIVGQEHSSRNILLEILNGLIVIDDKIRVMTKDDLAHRLYKCLKGRRYLVIMDDIWNVNAWKEVKGSFPDDYNGSRVVFTTRISNVALQAKSDCSPHYLRFFTIDESWELLQAKVFHKDPCPPDLREVGMLIARKCNGLPLAVVVIAGILVRIPASLSSWNMIADDLISYISSEGYMGTLELSYKNLPEALKSCLLYFGAFIKDKIITAKRLMLMWDAEGFLPKSMSERNNSLAKQCMNDLVDRSLVIVHSRSSTGGIKHCSVHDLIRDLCQSKSQEDQFFRFITISKGVRRFSQPVFYEQYRLCIHAEWEPFVKEVARGPIAHTLLYFRIPDHRVYSIEPFPYSNFKLVQLLDLQDVKFDCVGFAEELTTLINLRYLALLIGKSTCVTPTIANLWNLETFVIKRSWIYDITLPDTIWKMKRLRHVDVGQGAFVHLDSDVGQDSSKLPNLESFSSVTIAHGKDGEELLRRLSNARKLSCLFLTSWNKQRKCYEFPKMDHLTMLESLNIVSKGGCYCCVFSFPATLKKLSLSNFCLPWSKFPTIIGKLPCLEVLKLRSIAFRGHVWDMEEQEYPSLIYLELNDLNVTDWSASVDSFPCLEQLIVSYCYKLMEIPACFGEVPTMKTIEVHKSSLGAVESAIQIQKEQLEMGNKSLQVQLTR